MRRTIEPVHVVAPPPTRFVKTPPTVRVTPGDAVNEVALVSEKFPVVVALPVSV
jgi:hypothetical protein